MDNDEGTSTPLIGREREHEAIITFLTARISMRHAKVLFVCGPCGVGKTSTIRRVMMTPFSVQWIPLPEEHLTLAGSRPRRDNTHYKMIEGLSSSPEGAAQQVWFRRSVRSFYVNCADIGAKELVEEMVRLVSFGQRQSKHIETISALLRSCLSSAPSRQSSGRRNDDVDKQNGVPTAALTFTSLTSTPMLVFVLDEADYAKKATSLVLANLSRVALIHPLYFALMFVSNSRELSFLSSTHIQALYFAAYEAEELRKIGEAVVAGHGKGDAVLSKAAMEYSAKMTVQNHCGDARRITEYVTRAVEASVNHNKKAALDKEPVAGEGRRKRGREVHNGDSSAQPHVVSLTETVAVMKDGTRPDAYQLVQEFPSLTTYILCCIIALAKRSATRSFLAKTEIGGSVSGGHGKAQPPSAKSLAAAQAVVSKTLAKDCGEITLREVYNSYVTLMSKLMFPLSNRESVQRCVEELATRRVISEGKGGCERFVVTGQWTIDELETALLRKGSEIVREEEAMFGLGTAAGVGSLSNKFGDALKALSS